MSLKIKLISCISLFMLMIGVLIIGVFAATQTINLKGTVEFNVSDSTLYIKDIRLQTEPTGAAETIENFMPGYTNQSFDLNLGMVSSLSGSVNVYFDFINTTSTALAATATGGSGVTLSTSGIISADGVSITNVPTYEGISGTIILTIKFTGGTSGSVSLDGIVITIDEAPIVEVSSSDANLGSASAEGYAIVGEEVTLQADFTGNAEADFLGWKTSEEAEEFVSTMPDYTFTFKETSPTTYVAIFVEPISYLSYSYNGSATGEATFSSCSSEAEGVDIIIPSTIYRTSTSPYTFSVTSIGNSVFYIGYGFEITSIEIPASVTSIGNYTFAYTMLRSISFADNSQLISIGNNAFYMSSLTSIEIPSGVTSIGDWAFAYCSGLTSITLPSSLTSIGSYAFSYCSGLTEITFNTPYSWQISSSSSFSSSSILATLDASSVQANALTYLTDTYDDRYWRAVV